MLDNQMGNIWHEQYFNIKIHMDQDLGDSWPQSATKMAVSYVMVVPQIIQVMDEHDLVLKLLKQSWWLGDPSFQVNLKSPENCSDLFSFLNELLFCFPRCTIQKWTHQNSSAFGNGVIDSPLLLK